MLSYSYFHTHTPMLSCCFSYFDFNWCSVFNESCFWLWKKLEWSTSLSSGSYHPVKKSHTHEEGGTHLRISFWYLLINLKNNYLKKLLKWVNKKQNNFNIFNVAFKKKIKKNTCRYYYQNLMVYSSWNIEQNILKLVILGPFNPPHIFFIFDYFLPFYHPNNSKNEFF